MTVTLCDRHCATFVGPDSLPPSRLYCGGPPRCKGPLVSSSFRPNTNIYGLTLDQPASACFGHYLFPWSPSPALVIKLLAPQPATDTPPLRDMPRLLSSPEPCRRCGPPGVIPSPRCHVWSILLETLRRRLSAACPRLRLACSTGPAAVAGPALSAAVGQACNTRPGTACLEQLYGVCRRRISPTVGPCPTSNSQKPSLNSPDATIRPGVRCSWADRSLQFLDRQRDILDGKRSDTLMPMLPGASLVTGYAQDTTSWCLTPLIRPRGPLSSSLSGGWNLAEGQGQLPPAATGTGRGHGIVCHGCG